MTALRLDKWLWFARLAKTRSLAAKLCAGGGVTIGVVELKSGHPVRVGDHLVVRHGRTLRRVTVLNLGTRRGPPAEARLLYDELEPALSLRDIERAAWVPLIDERSNEPR
jgi:ribosome-associated heat shock protein Hsp15